MPEDIPDKIDYKKLDYTKYGMRTKNKAILIIIAASVVALMTYGDNIYERIEL